MKQNQKLCTNTKKVIDRGKRSKTLSEVVYKLDVKIQILSKYIVVVGRKETL